MNWADVSGRLTVKILASAAFAMVFSTEISHSWANDDAEEDRQIVQELIVGETPYPQEKGEIQITLEGNHFHAKESTSSGSAEVEYGITSSLQISIKAPYSFVHLSDDEDDESTVSSTRGIGDVEVGVAYAFLNERDRVFAAALDIGIPTGNEEKELGEGEVAVEASLRGGWRLRDAWLFTTLGFEIEDNEKSFQVGSAVAYPLSENIIGLVDFIGSVGDEKEAYIAPGLVVRGPLDTEFLLGVPLGINGDAADWGLVGKFLMEF
ncbi:hypothetical protein GGE65_008027 [Skermanella aerolata]|uniref:hypothetical protein n=1 Tax=Skermanella aerolata TaxID=393310 RepID=UPI003D1E1E40